AFASPGWTTDDEHTVGLRHQPANFLTHLLPHADLRQAGQLPRLVEDAHDQLLAGDAAGRGHAEVDLSSRLVSLALGHEDRQIAAGLALFERLVFGHLGREAAILRLSFLGDIEI